MEVRLKKGREKSAVNYHPWIFSGAVDHVQANDGDIVQVKSFDGKLIGYGFYDKSSQIICRIFHFGEASLELSSINYWKQKFQKALQLRNSFINKKVTNCFRLIHAEGDSMSGLIIDIYNDVAVVQFLITGTSLLKEIVFACLKDLGFEKIFVKNDPFTSKGYWAEGDEKLVQVIENGLRYWVDVEQGQKTGFFIDQRENRRIASSWVARKKILNLFSYTGGFSVSALKGGASKVVSVDVSKSALEICNKNIALNFPQANHQAVEEDCFLYLRRFDELFDFIIVDPPAFAKNQSAVTKAARGYKDLNMIAIKKVASPGMIMTFSCSQHVSKDLFQKIIFSAAADANRSVRIIKHLEQPEDHPINIYHPEGEYLKGLLLWVD